MPERRRPMQAKQRCRSPYFDRNNLHHLALLNIVIPQTMLFDTNAAMMKFRLVTVLRDAVDCGKVSFIEEHEPRVIAEEEE